MQALEGQLQITHQIQGQYLLSVNHSEQLMNNHIPIRKLTLHGSPAPGLLIYTEEIAYLMMVCNHQLYRQPQLKMHKLCQYLPQSLIELYQSLSANHKSYHNIQCIYFYLKVRKLSKLLYRQPIYLNQHTPLLGFKVFGKVEDYEKGENSKTIILVNNRQRIADVLDKKMLDLNGQVTMYITSSMDGIFVKIGQPFRISESPEAILYKEQS